MDSEAGIVQETRI